MAEREPGTDSLRETVTALRAVPGSGWKDFDDPLAELADLRGGTDELHSWPEPQPITDAQKTGERFLVWNDSEYPDTRGWFTAFYDGKIDGWLIGALGGYTELDRVVAHLPLPSDVKP